MMETDIKSLNELTSKILFHEEKILSLKSRITQLKSANDEWCAEMELTIGRGKYKSSSYPMRKEEVLPVLEIRLKEQENHLLARRKEYDAIK